MIEGFSINVGSVPTVKFKNMGVLTTYKPLIDLVQKGGAASFICAIPQNTLIEGKCVVTLVFKEYDDTEIARTVLATNGYEVSNLVRKATIEDGFRSFVIGEPVVLN